MIYLNDNELDNLHIGDKEIQRVLLGESLIWENNKVVSLGWGRNFNISGTLPNKYTQLSTSNIFFLSMSNLTTTEGFSGTGYLTIRTGFTKTYNASNGAMQMNPWCQRDVGTVSAVVVTKPSKLTYLGTATSFNVKSRFPNDYMNFTVNNFLISGINQYNNGLILNAYRGVEGSWNATNHHDFIKSYNNSTGVLTCYLRDYGQDNTVERWDFTSPVSVYVTKKVPA